MTCEHIGAGSSRVLLRQSGCDDSARWRRSYGVITGGRRESLEPLREYLERERSSA